MHQQTADMSEITAFIGERRGTAPRGQTASQWQMGHQPNPGPGEGTADCLDSSVIGAVGGGDSPVLTSR